LSIEGSGPVVVSFSCGDRYYHDAAARLREDCVRWGVAHDIVELSASPASSWIDICRRKVSFIQTMHLKHRRPILWLDVDSRLGGNPASILQGQHDFAAFLRGFRYFRDFDAATIPRTFAPYALYFGVTPNASAFLELMAQIERDHDGPATDDYFLQEAWARHASQISVLLLPPDLVGREWPLTDRQIFYVGISGNVSTALKVAQQHQVPTLPPARLKAVLSQEASTALKDAPEEALVLWKRALRAGGPDDAMALKVARLTKRLHGLAAAVGFLRTYAAKSPQANLAVRFAAESELEEGHLVATAEALKQLGAEASESDRTWAQFLSARLALEQRAARLGIPLEQRPALWWPADGTRRRFSDALALYLVERLTGRPPRVAARGPAIMVGGDTISGARTGHLVWGSGAATEHDGIDMAAEFRAVRGPLTRRRVLDLGGQCPNVLGDPSLLLPTVYQPASRVKNKLPLGLVVDDGATPILAGVPTVTAAGIGDRAVESFIDGIHGFERVVTASLYGLVLCHAYGIPVHWIDQDETKGPSGWACRDHLLSLDLNAEPADPAEVSSGSRLPSAAPHSATLDSLRAGLLTAAPFATQSSSSPSRPRWFGRRH
jgi:hypothetical protein